MRNHQHEGITDDGENVEGEKGAPVSPKIDQDTARIGVNRAEQRAQRIVKADDEHSGAERLQIFRDKAHPEFFAWAYAWIIGRLHRLFRMRLRGSKFNPQPKGQKWKSVYVAAVSGDCRTWVLGSEIARPWKDGFIDSDKMAQKNVEKIEVERCRGMKDLG